LYPEHNNQYSIKNLRSNAGFFVLYLMVHIRGIAQGMGANNASRMKPASLVNTSQQMGG
jgi:hypothetical protein